MCCYLTEAEILHLWPYPRLSAELKQHDGALKTLSWDSLQCNDGKQMPVCLSQKGCLLNTQYVPYFSSLLSHLWLNLLIILAGLQTELLLHQIPLLPAPSMPAVSLEHLIQ